MVVSSHNFFSSKKFVSYRPTPVLLGGESIYYVLFSVVVKCMMLGFAGSHSRCCYPINNLVIMVTMHV